MSFPITSFKEQIKWVLRAVIHLSVRRVRLAWTHIFEGCNCCIVRLRGCNSAVSGNILFVVKAPLPEAYVTFIAGVTLLDHLLWKHRSLESSWQNQNHPTNRCQNRNNLVTLWCKILVRPLNQINQKQSKIDAKLNGITSTITSKTHHHHFQNSTAVE